MAEINRSTFLTFPGRVLGFFDAAEQFVNRDHRNRAIRRRDLAQPLHHAGPLPQHADAGVRVEQVRHGHLQVFHWRQLTLLWALKRGVGDVD